MLKFFKRLFCKHPAEKLNNYILEELLKDPEEMLSSLLSDYNATQKETFNSLRDLQQVYPDDCSFIFKKAYKQIEHLAWSVEFDGDEIFIFTDLLIEDKKDFIDKLKSGKYSLGSIWRTKMHLSDIRSEENKEQFVVIGKIKIKDIDLVGTIKYLINPPKEILDYYSYTRKNIIIAPTAEVYIEKIYDSRGRDTVINKLNKIKLDSTHILGWIRNTKNGI